MGFRYAGEARDAMDKSSSGKKSELARKDRKAHKKSKRQSTV
jgi:hypothetical protein